MSVQRDRALEVLEAELADVDLGEAGVVWGIGGGVPRSHLVPAKLHQTQLVVLAPLTAASLQHHIYTVRVENAPHHHGE